LAGGWRLPEAMRAELARPFGPVVATERLREAVGADLVLAVGDVVSLTLKRLGIVPKLFVCDFQTQRSKPDPAFWAELGSWGTRELRVQNPAGHLRAAAFQAVREALADPAVPVRIVVEGEEDLLGIPCFLEAPLGAIVLYGMPGRGVAVVRVTPEVRAMAQGLLDRFEPE
jgi:GTP-dependent dephospho-CoA kinase